MTKSGMNLVICAAAQWILTVISQSALQVTLNHGSYKQARSVEYQRQVSRCFQFTVKHN